ncbi:hypothetical protein A3H38_04855 [candidate division WOR-1 bacterium RIFCSPLOWO2_02_FULL_46_20]|uniref:Uncharacterized protein n=2 Tax=Saganbacteria TaxID=1703751 RepID=A0A1F4R418_UNCSA|nr:MAG: hypothetical protein A3J44_05890 [candidate division WOR-1 bacterium RIFCSPHIGHO2_02_FULL_45_12]OGC02919.1 MAG: hypothetical protein A3H38_04855 [candidate division WOR-1 bacterium RIFCSPLOWO2_02_FULL_46_20]OGC08548.1 MAG: hypothetical protein A3F86_04815 [candidate division WOR-1 bacterium RIFCSPLOWO2_12_FULL_45_9]
MPEQLKDIKGIFYVLDLWTFLYFFSLFLGLAAIAYYLYLVSKRQKPVTVKLTPAHPFHIIALEALEQINPEEYFDRKALKEYYFIITEIVREFLAQNYRIDTLEKTSFELIEELERVERDYDKVKRLDHYLSECDLVKFAKFKPALSEMKLKKDESIRIIRDCHKNAL